MGLGILDSTDTKLDTKLEVVCFNFFHAMDIQQLSMQMGSFMKLKKLLVIG